jgi:hypothetical protein
MSGGVKSGDRGGHKTSPNLKIMRPESNLRSAPCFSELCGQWAHLAENTYLSEDGDNYMEGGWT